MNCDLDQLRLYIQAPMKVELDFLEHLENCPHCRELLYEVRRGQHGQDYRGRNKPEMPDIFKEKGRETMSKPGTIKPGSKTAKIFEAIKQAGIPVSTPEIVELSGVPQPSVGAFCKQLYDRGFLARTQKDNQWVYTVNGEVSGNTTSNEEAKPERSAEKPSLLTGQAEEYLEQIMRKYEGMEELLKQKNDTIVSQERNQAVLEERVRTLERQLEEAGEKLRAQAQSKAERRFVDWAKGKLGAA